MVEGKGGIASGYILVYACPLIGSAGLQRHWCCIFDSAGAIFGVGAVDKIDIEISAICAEIDTLYAEGKHEIIACVIGNDVHRAGVVLVVDILIGEDDVFIDGVDGCIWEYYDEKDEDYDWDYATY